MPFFDKFAVVALGVMIFSFVSVMLILNVGLKDYESRKNYVKTTEGFAYYYNGEEVDGDSVDLDLYSWTVDINEKKVYLTNKAGSTDIVPVILPVR